MRMRGPNGAVVDVIRYTDTLGYDRRVYRLSRHRVFIGEYKTPDELGKVEAPGSGPLYVGGACPIFCWGRLWGRLLAAEVVAGAGSPLLRHDRVMADVAAHRPPTTHSAHTSPYTTFGSASDRRHV